MARDNARDNEALVRGAYEAFARGDLDAVLAALDAQIEWHTPATLPWSRGAYRGHAGVREYFTSFLTHLEAPRIVPDELLVCGDRVVGLGFERARARATGTAFAAEFAHIWTLRGGRVVRLHGIVDTATIRRAFRPEPEPAPPPTGPTGGRCAGASG
jgi:ketosteroid isomerase-like protein